MLRLTIDGEPCEAPQGATILDALHARNLEVPTLCHDDRLHPTGACRLCVVAVKGWNHHATVCNTELIDCMEIETHTPAIEDARRTLLRLQAARYPEAAVDQAPEKPFHHWLRHYGVSASGNGAHDPFPDTTHPYLQVDMARCITRSRFVRICDELQGRFAWRTWGRGDATRILPNNGASLLESDCVGWGPCADTCPTGAIEDRSVLEHGTPEKWTRTTCLYCRTGCEMLVGTRGDRIVQVKPVADSPVSKGHLCVKGRYAFGFTHAADRVREAMIRENSEWRTVTWEKSNTFVAARLRGILETHGPKSVGMFNSARGTNEENYVAMKRMLGTGAATNSFDDIEHAASFLICGCNPTEAHPIIGARIKQAVLGGARLIVIDPRATELTQYADVHLALRPGTNVPLLNALARVISDESLADSEALRERFSGGEEFRDFVRAWTPERAASICGVNADDIRKAARIYATSTPAMAFHGLGMSEHIQGTEGVMALVNLALLSGNFGKPGSGVNPLRGQNNVQGSAHMGCEPGHLTGFVPLVQGRDVFTAAWNTPLPVAAGLNLMEMIDATGRSELKALWAIGYDVSFTNPDTIRSHEALGSVDLVIVQDLFNELARKFGHVFLPAASPFEKDGTFMNSERRVQRIRRAVPAPGHALADWEIGCGVARAMGHGGTVPFHSTEESWNEIRGVWKAGAGISYERIEGGGLQWPCPDESHPGTKILHVDSSHASATGLNHLTGEGRDAQAMTPEYKVVAVRLDRKGGGNPMPEIFGFDCYSPREIAARVETVGVNKANLPLVPMLALGVLSDAQLSFAISRVPAGAVFSLGLILVVIAGAELFPGNKLLVMACVSHRNNVRKLLGNLIIVHHTIYRRNPGPGAAS